MMQDETLRQFCGETASKAATPGGGSVAALTGALATALAEMVAALTAEKPGYEPAWEEMAALGRDGAALREKLLALIDADCAAYQGFLAALRLPKGSEAERTARQTALCTAAKTAAEVPMQTARGAFEVLRLAQTAAEKGNRAARSDAVMSAILARAAVRCAAANVRINLPSLGDDTLAAAYECECARLEAEAAAGEAAVLSGSESRN